MQVLIFFGLGSFQYDMLLQNQLGPVGLTVFLHTVGCGVPNLACDKAEKCLAPCKRNKVCLLFPLCL